MSQVGETFFTVVGCMDGRVQEVVAAFGKKKFKAVFPDTITDAGIVGVISKNPDPDYFLDLQRKLNVSLDRHHSAGIIVNGHQECAGNPVDDESHKKDIERTIKFIKILTNNKVPVMGLFVIRGSKGWFGEEI